MGKMKSFIAQHGFQNINMRQRIFQLISSTLDGVEQVPW